MRSQPSPLICKSFSCLNCIFQDYIFSLLTGYCETPAGFALPEDTHYNPYFYGGAIAMAEALYNEIIEYSDGKIIYCYSPYNILWVTDRSINCHMALSAMNYLYNIYIDNIHTLLENI